MSKYTEAIERYKHWYERGFNHSDMPSSGILVTMGKALEIADRLEQADAEEMAIRIGCSKCHHTMCRRNPKYEGEQDLFEVRCDLFSRFKNDAIIRGDNNG